jgi:hypothetical protein
MAPKIVTEDGQEVYGTSYVSRDYAVQVGVVGYAKSIDQAKTNDRIKDNPLIVKGLRASGTNKTDIVISAQDASAIKRAASSMNFMEKCKVMIVLD